MAKPVAPDGDEDKPLDPEVEKIRRRMVRLLAISIGTLLLGLMTVLGAIVYKINVSSDKKPEVETTQLPASTGVLAIGEIKLPDNAAIVSSSLSGSRILLQVKLVDGRTSFMVFDMESTKLIAAYPVTK